jgi:hypothetical protein
MSYHQMNNYIGFIVLLLLVVLLVLLLLPKKHLTPKITEQVGAIFDVKAGPLSGCRDHTAIYNTEPYLKNIVYAKH